jgi:hypothetical protein
VRAQIVKALGKDTHAAIKAVMAKRVRSEEARSGRAAKMAGQNNRSVQANCENSSTHAVDMAIEGS